MIRTIAVALVLAFAAALPLMTAPASADYSNCNRAKPPGATS